MTMLKTSKFTTLIQSRKLKKLGFEMESDVYWTDYYTHDDSMELLEISEVVVKNNKGAKFYKAYDTDDLLRALPSYVSVFRTEDKCWSSSYIKGKANIQSGNTPVSSLCKMLIYLKKG